MRYQTVAMQIPAASACSSYPYHTCPAASGHLSPQWRLASLVDLLAYSRRPDTVDKRQPFRSSSSAFVVTAMVLSAYSSNISARSLRPP